MSMPETTTAARPRDNMEPFAPAVRRERLAAFMALAAAGILALTLLLADSTHFLMPGPLTSAHGTIEKCSSCHSEAGTGTGLAKLSWLRGLVAANSHADSKACATCHKMPDTAFNAHGASASVLQTSTERLLPIAAKLSPPQSTVAQSKLFPTHDMVSQGIQCATCHQEHQGSRFKLNRISNAQCQSCHVAQFASFDRGHPEFENYPFRRRTRIVYDHDGHFSKHYPEVAKKDQEKRIPETCSTCHNSRADKRLMSVAPFEKTCSTCHLDQIVGKERASGPKGIAFLTLPGLDVQSLKSKNAAIGNWPEASDAALTPFMKVMIARTERGRALLTTVDRLNLQDLGQANAESVKAVTNLVWEIKSIFRDLIASKAGDVLGSLNIADGAKLSAQLVADLTANIPRDVIISAQKQWLPNLATEMGVQKVSGDKANDGWPIYVAPPATIAAQISNDASAAASPEEASGDAVKAAAERSGSEEAAKNAGNTNGGQKKRLDPPACTLRVLGQCLVSKETTAPSDDTNAKSASGANTNSPKETLPPAMRAGLNDLRPNVDAASADRHESRTAQLATNEAAKSSSQDDELLRPTPEEQRAIDARKKAAGKGSSSNADNQAGAATAAPVISIESSVDPESWAEAGGWYRQDYAILYRPSGHKDKFIYSWLFLTGPLATKGDAKPATAVFDVLAGKDAQGSCTKCHSVDDLQSKGRVVNFTPVSLENKKGNFTTFIHEPHFGTVEKEGCFTCHSLEKGRGYLKSYEQGNALVAAVTFGAVKKETCQQCHTDGAARQDCMTCHKYHVNGAQTPMTNTKLPIQ